LLPSHLARCRQHSQGASSAAILSLFGTPTLHALIYVSPKTHPKKFHHPKATATPKPLCFASYPGVPEAAADRHIEYRALAPDPSGPGDHDDQEHENPSHNHQCGRP
jgi:hypothetical protein